MSSTPYEVFANHQMDFAGVASSHSSMLFRIALRRLGNNEDAEDAVQDALLSAYKHIDQFQGRSQLSSWLTRIVINVAGMKLRSRMRREVVSLDQAPEDAGATRAIELVDPGPNPEAICAQAEMGEILCTALAQISPKLRDAFQMRELAGLSTRETADRLRIKTTTLKSRVRRARMALGFYLHRINRVRPGEHSNMASRNRTVGLAQARKNWRAGQKIAGAEARPIPPKCCGKPAEDVAIRTFKTKTKVRTAVIECTERAIIPSLLPQSDGHMQESMTFTS